MTRTYVLGRAVPGSPVTVSLCGAEMTITVRVRSMDATSADVTVCRTSQAGRESSCSDGLDNDCDGWTDQDDPDCGGGGRPPAPVASPPPIALVLRSPPPSPPPRRPPPPWLSPPPPPSPSPPPAFPSSSEMTVSEMYFSDSNNVYELFRAPLGYQQAIDFCAGRGATTGLSLYRTDEDRAAIDKLCAGISCWLAKPIPSEACPVLTAGKFKTDCPSSYSFVCKRSFEETVVPTPAPIPSPSPVPAPPAPIVVTGDVVITDSAVFRLYRSPTSYAMAVEACAANGGGATMAVYRFAEDKAAMDTLCSGITCWLAKPNPDSACPAVSIPEGKFKSDCGGVYAYVCRLPPISSDAPTPDVAPVPAGDSRVIKGMLFELMRVEATYQQAKDVCASRGAGSTMAVYRYASDKAAMKRLCESLTCWLAKPKPDKTCPTVSDRGFRSDCAGSYAYVCKRPAPGVKAMGTAPGPADGPEYSAGDSPVTSQPEAEQDYEDYDVPQPPAGDDDVAVGAVDTSDYGDSSAADSSAVQSAAAGATSGP